MTAYRQLRIYLYFLLALLTSGCQLAAPDGPGFNFALFQDTRAAGLARAVESEDTALIRKYVVTDAIPIDIREPTFGNTLLFLSVVDNKERSTKQLLDLGANPNETGFDGTSPFLAACHYQWRITHPRQVLQLLIDKGADVNSVQIDTTNNQFGKKQHYHATALQLACSYGRLPSVQLLVENGASLTAYGENSESLLATAVLTGKLDILKYLMIDKKAPIPDHVFIRQPDTKHEKILRISDVLNEHDWTGQSWKSWSGTAFERICLKHVQQLKKAISIAAVYTEESAWRYQPKTGKGAQIRPADRSKGFCHKYLRNEICREGVYD